VACGPDDTPLSIVLRVAPQVKREFLRVAIDSEFVTWETPVGNARELAFLPPVSGG
jgi:molybdopterin synthase sulfur carrier subunit